PEALAEVDGLLEDGALLLRGHLVPHFLVLVDQQHVAHVGVSSQLSGRTGAGPGACRRNALARAMRRVQLQGGARRPHARRTPCTLSVRPRAPMKQMGPYHRSSVLSQKFAYNSGCHIARGLAPDGLLVPRHSDRALS